MTRDEFLSLPPAVATRLIFDALDEQTIFVVLSQEKPKLPLPPKYDYAIWRRDGVQHASETDLAGLRFWHKRAVTSAEGGGQYAERDKKNAGALQRWIDWRECCPDTVWSGERNRDFVVARGPCARPAVYAVQRNGAARQPQNQQDDEVDPATF